MKVELLKKIKGGGNVGATPHLNHIILLNIDNIIAILLGVI